MVLAPVSVETLDATAERVHRAERPFGELRHPWELRAGTGAYAALYTREPGTEASEWTLAETLSETCDEPVYSLWLDSEHPRMIYAWRAGKKLDEREGDPIAFARDLGIALAPPDVSAPEERSVITVAVVDGLGVDAVRALLGGAADEGWLRLTDGASSTILSAADGDLRAAPWDLTDALRDRDVYFVYGDLVRRELNIQVLRGGQTIGTFYAPAIQGDDVLSAIKGARTVSGVLEALGVGPELFPRGGWHG
jgi:hypothetical protein